jgi:hypothetical protein
MDRSLYCCDNAIRRRNANIWPVESEYLYLEEHVLNGDLYGTGKLFWSTWGVTSRSSFLNFGRYQDYEGQRATCGSRATHFRLFHTFLVLSFLWTEGLDKDADTVFRVRKSLAYLVPACCFRQARSYDATQSAIHKPSVSPGKSPHHPWRTLEAWTLIPVNSQCWCRRQCIVQVTRYITTCSALLWRYFVISTLCYYCVKSSTNSMKETFLRSYQPLRQPINFRPFNEPQCFLAAFAKLRKATISFVMYVCLSVSIELGSHWMDFHEIV